MPQQTRSIYLPFVIVDCVMYQLPNQRPRNQHFNAPISIAFFLCVPRLEDLFAAASVVLKAQNAEEQTGVDDCFWPPEDVLPKNILISFPPFLAIFVTFVEGAIADAN